MTSSGNCGCSQPKVDDLSPEAVRQTLMKQRAAVGLLQDESQQPNPETFRGRGKGRGDNQGGGLEVGFGFEIPIIGGGRELTPCTEVARQELCEEFSEVERMSQPWCKSRRWWQLPCWLVQLCFSCGSHFKYQRDKTIFECRRADGSTIRYAACSDWTFVDCCDTPDGKPSCSAGAAGLCDSGNGTGD